MTGILILMAIFAFISWRNYRMLTRIFSLYRNRMVGYTYLFLTLTSCLVMGYGLQVLPPFVVNDIKAFHVLVYGALAWVFGQIILLCFQPFLYVAHRLTKGKAVQPPQVHPSAPIMTRRGFLHGTLTVVSLLPFGISGQGVYGAQNDMTVTRHQLPMPGLPLGLDGYKIAQVSDFHLGPHFDLARLDMVINLLTKEMPDLVAITGDLADDSTLLRPAIDRISELHIPHGIFFCMGNHDYLLDAQLVRSELNNSRIILLDNSSRLVMTGKRPFYLMGVDYPWEDYSNSAVKVSASNRREYLTTASRDVPPDAFRILIGHHPDILFDGFAEKIPLTLAGHTHGGQIVVNGRSPFTIHHYTRDLYQENGVYGYISRGAGHWFPFRLGCPPEITTFTLRKKVL